MTDIHDVLADDDDGGWDTVTPWQPSPWWAWTAATGIAGVSAMLASGVAMSGARFGTSLRARGCDADVVPGLFVLVAGAFLLMIAGRLARLRHPGSVLTWSMRPPLLAMPVPALLLVATLPGIMGCAVASDIADLALIGDALVGVAGIVLCGAASALLGAGASTVAHVTWQAPGGSQTPEAPGIVELAMQEAEALQAEGSHRFLGVDD